MKSKLLIFACFLMVSCGSSNDKGSKAPSTPPKPSKPPVASVAPSMAPVAPQTPAIQAAPIAAPTYPQVGGPTSGNNFSSTARECPNGPIRRLFYNVFHAENCVR